MKTQILIPLLMLSLGAVVAAAQEKTRTPQTQQETSGRHEPPAQAYEDCKGKKAGDTVQHTTREGKVAATCADSPKGLVARPIQPKNP